VVGSRDNRRRSMTKAILDLRTLIKVVEQKVEGMEEVVEHMEILERKKVATIKGQHQAKIIAYIHLERIGIFYYREIVGKQSSRGEGKE
jgi:hypothetical protein